MSHQKTPSLAYQFRFKPKSGVWSYPVNPIWQATGKPVYRSVSSRNKMEDYDRYCKEFTECQRSFKSKTSIEIHDFKDPVIIVSLQLDNHTGSSKITI
jgi:hypothetical protein